MTLSITFKDINAIIRVVFRIPKESRIVGNANEATTTATKSDKKADADNNDNNALLSLLFLVLNMDSKKSRPSTIILHL